MSTDPDHLLHTLRETLLAEIRSDHPDLTLRQLSVLLVVYLTSKPQTVRALAAQLGVRASIISRALDRLTELDLAHREVDPFNRRSLWVRRTPHGAALVKRLGVAMAQAAVAAETYTMSRDGIEQAPADV